MSVSDSGSQEREKCPLCCGQLKKVLQCETDRDGRPFVPVDCDICGRYILDKMVHLTGIPPEKRGWLSAIVRRHYEFVGRPRRITSEDCEEVAAQGGPGKTDVPTKVRYLLRYVAHKSQFPGQKVGLTGEIDYPVCFADNVDEFAFYVQYLHDMGFVSAKTLGRRGESQVWLTPKGWEELRHIPTLESGYAFVAMSFSKEGSHGALLTQAFEEAIKPAIEDDAGYVEAIRIDRKDFLGDIVFEIIARIKESRFVVADVTQHRNGVYFEAGYAMGMGLPVIWTCHKDDMQQAHFDTSHLNHIVWDNPAELRKSLANRILATIGRGPKERT